MLCSTVLATHCFDLQYKLTCITNTWSTYGWWVLGRLRHHIFEKCWNQEGTSHYKQCSRRGCFPRAYECMEW